MGGSAEPYMEHSYYGEVLPELAKANAALIAAAPALLEAATKALNYIENTENELGIKLVSGDMLRAALTQAQP